MVIHDMSPCFACALSRASHVTLLCVSPHVVVIVLRLCALCHPSSFSVVLRRAPSAVCPSPKISPRKRARPRGGSMQKKVQLTTVCVGRGPSCRACMLFDTKPGSAPVQRRPTGLFHSPFWQIIHRQNSIQSSPQPAPSHSRVFVDDHIDASALVCSLCLATASSSTRRF